MRLIIIFIGLSIASCSAPKLYNQGIKKINKAIEKDPSLKIPEKIITDIDTVYHLDTVTNTLTKEIIKTVTKDTCIDDSAPTRRELRYLRRTYTDSLKHERKMFKMRNQALEDSLDHIMDLYIQETKRKKQEGKVQKAIAKSENKSSPFLRFVGRMWWLFLIIGLIGGFYIRKLIFK